MVERKIAKRARRALLGLCLASIPVVLISTGASAFPPSMGSITPQPVAPGTTLSVNTSGWESTNINFYWNNVYVAHTFPVGAPQDANVQFKVPNSPDGANVLVAGECGPAGADISGCSGNPTLTANVQVQNAEIASLFPQPVAPGANLSVNALGGNGGPLAIFWNGNFGTVIASATADSSGHANGVSVPVPSPLANGTYGIEICTPPASPPFNCVPDPAPGVHAVIVVNPAPSPVPPAVAPPRPKVPAAVPSPSPLPTPSPSPAPTATPAPPVAILPSPAPAPAASPTAPAPSSSSLPSYDPASEPVKTANLAIAAVTILSLGGVGGLAAAGAAGGVLGASTGRGGTPDRGPERSEVKEATEGKLADDEIIHSRLARDAVGRGDNSWTWRAPGRGLFDSLSSALPVSLAAGSPLMARVSSDGSYLEAIFGSASVLAVLVGVGLGLVAVNDVGGHAVPPSLAVTLALLVLGALNAEAGLVGVATFIGGVLVLGGINSASAVRTIFGLAALWFVIPIVASAARPLRRLPSENLEQRWDRAADFAIASLVGAFAVQQIILGFPGLAGEALPIAQYANLCAVVVLGALAVRWFAETLAVNLYPHRLSTVHPQHIPEPPAWQLLGGALLRTAGLAFIAVAFVGPRWQLAVGAGLYLLPQLLGVWEERFPNIPSVYRILPRGLVKLVLILVVAKGLKTIAFSVDTDPRDAIADAFVLMLIPVAILGLLDLFGREGEQSKLRWWQRISGLALLAVGVWFVLVIGT